MLSHPKLIRHYYWVPRIPDSVGAQGRRWNICPVNKDDSLFYMFKSVSDQYFAILNLSFGFFSFWDKFRFVKYFLGFLSLTHRQVRYLLRWLTYFVTCVCQKHTWISHFWKRTCMIDRLHKVKKWWLTTLLLVVVKSKFGTVTWIFWANEDGSSVFSSVSYAQ